MILSDKTLALLKSLSKVNRSVLLKKGKVQRAASADSTIVVEVVLDDEIPVDFAVYDLNQLLGLLNTLKDANLDFSETTLTIADRTGWTATYSACAKELINDVQSMEAIDSAPIALAFDLPADTLSKMSKIASSNELAQIAFLDTPEGIIMKAFNKKVTDSNSVTVPLTKEPKSPDLCVKTPFIMSTSNLVVEADAYQVLLADLGFARFESRTGQRRYVVLTEMETK